jgi:hypothetical protein
MDDFFDIAPVEWLMTVAAAALFTVALLAALP